MLSKLSQNHSKPTEGFKELLLYLLNPRRFCENVSLSVCICK